jgi:cytochrome c-type biogenesis protein CcmH
MQWLFLKRARLTAGLFAAVVLLLGAGDDATRIDQLGHQIMCVCGCGQVLLECSHAECGYLSQMRSQLTSAVNRGGDDNSILQWFVQNYGPTVLPAPTHTGFNQVAWIMPYLTLVLGIALVVFIVWVWKGRAPSQTARIPAAVRGMDLDGFRQQARRETEI